MPENESQGPAIRSTRNAMNAWRPLLAAGAMLLCAAAAQAERVVQVRVGEHESFTRVVIELDGPATHHIVRSMRSDAGPELVVRIDAASEPRRITSKSRVVDAVTLSPEGGATVARVSLRAPGVRIDEKRFANPARIVLDLHPTAAGETSHGEPTSVRADSQGADANTALPSPDSLPATDTSARDAAVAAEVPGAGAPLSNAAAELEAAAASPDAALDVPRAGDATGDGLPSEPDTAAAPSPADETALAAAPAPAAAPSTGEPTEVREINPPPAPALAEPSTPGGVDPSSPAASSTAASSPVASNPAASSAAAPLSTAGADARGDVAPNVSGPPTTLLPGGVDLRVLVGGAVVLLSVFLLWGVLGRRDRTSREVVEEISSEGNAFADRPTTLPWEAGTRSPSAIADEPGHGEDDDAPALHPSPSTDAIADGEPRIVVRGEALEPSEIAPAVAGHTPGPVGVVGDLQTSDMIEEDDRPVPRLVLVQPPGGETTPSDVRAQSEASTGADVAAGADAISEPVGAAIDRVRTLEQRIATLERRLEDAAESRERIERQVVAQTEELRVQRAAIARTQRVLRSIAKPEELAMEPVPPRGPSGATG